MILLYAQSRRSPESDAIAVPPTDAAAAAADAAP